MSSLLAHIFKGRTYLGFLSYLFYLYSITMPFLFKIVLVVRTVIKKRWHFTQSQRVKVTIIVTASPVNTWDAGALDCHPVCPASPALRCTQESRS